jgi:predicted PurR-regulated permease PerM
VSAKKLVLNVPGAVRVHSLLQNPEILTNGAAGLLDQARGLPYAGEQIGVVDQVKLRRLVQSNAPSPGQLLSVTLDFILGAFGVLLNLLLMLLISVYLLLDRERISTARLSFVPATIRDQTIELFHAVESTLIKYLRGQLLFAIMAAIGWAFAYFTFGRYSLLIGLWIGVTEIIPVFGAFLGAFLGAVPAVATALFSSGFTQALVVAALFLLAQQLEGNILGLKIQDSSVGVHPLWVLFATLAATVLYGIFGAILAVPIVAILAATLRYLRRTPLFEGWRKPPNVMVAPEEAEPREGPAVPAESPTTGEKVSVRSFVDRKR